MIHAKLTSRLPQIIGELPSQVREALGETADAVSDATKERAPVASGALRDAIHVEEVDGGYRVVVGDENVFYAHIVEYGGVNSSSRPFFTPAIEAERANHLKRVADVLESL